MLSQQIEKTGSRACAAADDSAESILKIAQREKWSNAKKGEYAETFAESAYRSQGYEKFYSKLNSNNGIDGIFVKRGKDGKLTEIVFNEAKWNSKNTELLLRDTKTMGQQMSLEWIEKTLGKMAASKDPALKATAREILEAFAAGKKAKLTANVFNPEGAACGTTEWFDLGTYP